MNEAQMRTAALSETTMTEYVLPTHANALGNVFGGQILAWMDICAAICCQRHCGSIAVTAGIDDLAFEQPIKVGQVVRVQARVTATFRTSLEVQVVVTGENPLTRTTWLCVHAFLTFVAIDAKSKPASVPPLTVHTEAERLLEQQAHQRRAHRLARRASILHAQSLTLRGPSLHLR